MLVCVSLRDCKSIIYNINDNIKKQVCFSLLSLLIGTTLFAEEGWAGESGHARLTLHVDMICEVSLMVLVKY